MQVLILIGAPILAGIVLFFVLPILEKPKQKVLHWIGIKHSGKIVTLAEDPKGEMIRKPADTEVSKLNLVNRLSPFEISQTVESAPLLQRPEIAKHYIGVRLDCTGELATMTREGGGLVSVHIVVSTPTQKFRELVHIHFMVNQSDYAGLTLLRYGEPIHVSGLIKKVEPGSISMSDSKIMS